MPYLHVSSPVLIRGTITSLLLTTLVLIQPRMPLAYLGTCWLTFSWLSNNIPRSSSFHVTFLISLWADYSMCTAYSLAYPWITLEVLLISPLWEVRNPVCSPTKGHSVHKTKTALISMSMPCQAKAKPLYRSHTIQCSWEYACPASKRWWQAQRGKLWWYWRLRLDIGRKFFT